MTLTLAIPAPFVMPGLPRYLCQAAEEFAIGRPDLWQRSWVKFRLTDVGKVCFYQREISLPFQKQFLPSASLYAMTYRLAVVESSANRLCRVESEVMDGLFR